MASIVYLILLLALVHSSGDCAWLVQQQGEEKTADLSQLINETLSLNNKSLVPIKSSQAFGHADSLGGAFKDDWTFERVEYDLMEFLQDLGARYQLKRNPPSAGHDAPIEARKEQASTEAAASKLSSQSPSHSHSHSETTTSSSNYEATKLPELATYTASIAASTTEISTSLASDDHDIAESKWQYGIFDRFTRAKAPSTSTTTTRDPYVDSLEKFDVRQFNSDECGLRTYTDDRDDVRRADELGLDNRNEEASKDLNQRRQRPNLSLLSQKRYQLQGVLQGGSDAVGDSVAAPSSSMVSNWANQFEKDAYDSYKQQQQQQKSADFGAPNLLGSETSAADSEFNLASRRHWLQQQLGNTLQLLGFNGSAQSVAEFLNQTSGLSLNNRENMMKKSNQNLGQKLGKSAQLDQPTHMEQQQREREPSPAPPSSLSARQDELKLEARVIGGSDARLGDSPWSVSLQALVSRPGTSGVEYRHYCGGTIISEYYVLTAAHCLDFMVGRESRLFVVIGDLNWRMSTISVYGRRFGIEKLIIHSGYKSTAFGHDIGLIRTKESMKPLKSNGRYIVNSVCLPERGVEHSGEAELVGWGLFSNRNEMADSLQIADVPILPRPLCVDLYRRRTGLIQWLIGIELITDKQICAGTFGRGICQGDSGSALVFNQKVHLMMSGKRNKQAAAKSVRELSALASASVASASASASASSSSLSLLSSSDRKVTSDDQSLLLQAAAAAAADDDAGYHQQEEISGKGILRSGHEHREQLQSRATIIGIVAFGGIRRCSYQSLPGVYMQTSKYMDWILPRIQS